MQTIHFAVVLFYYGLVAVPVTLLMVWIQSLVKEEPIQLFNYTTEQYCYMLLVCSINFCGLNSNTIASQNERSGFVTLIGYVGLVYAFFGDLFIFDETLQWLQLLGVLIILICNVAVIWIKL